LGAAAGKLIAVDAIPAAHGLDDPVEIQPAEQTLLPAQVAMGLSVPADLQPQPFEKSLAAQRIEMGTQLVSAKRR
jgi:hypothetical protein